MTVTRWRLAAMLMPAMLVVAGFFGLGMFEVMRQSVGLGSNVAGYEPYDRLASGKV